MYPKLVDRAYIKLTPEKEKNILSFVVNNSRNYLCVNETAARILELCNGKNSIENISSELVEVYDEKYEIVKKYIMDFLEPLVEAGIIKNNKENNFTEKSNIVKGSRNVYYPNALCLEVTDYCPLNCRHCYLDKKNFNIISKEHLEEVLKIIDATGIIQVQITGGEALTYPYLEELIDNLINRNIVTVISTSAFGYNEKILKFLEKIKKVNGSMLRISLDGMKETHNYIRNNERAYDEAIKFLKENVKRGVSCQIETSLIDQTHEEIDELISRVKELGACSIEIGKLYEQGNARKNNLQLVWSKEEHLAFLEEMGKKHNNEHFFVKTEAERKIKNCGAGYEVVRITSSLDITPCPMMEFKMGNLKQEKYYDIIAKYNEIFKTIEAPCRKLCGECDNFESCQSCMAIGYNTKELKKDCCWFNTYKDALSK